MNPTYQNVYSQLLDCVKQQHQYRRTCLNMVAAENVTSPIVERVVGSDFSRRYSSPGVYAGDRYFLPAYEMTLDLMRQLFKVKFITIKPATGNLAVLSILTSLTSPGDKVIKVGDTDGGYPIRLADWAGVEILPFPFDFDRLNIKAEEACQMITRVRPKLVIFGASEFLYPHPVREIAEAAHAVGSIVAYDGSHVMGLIAGGEFQNPLEEGADVLYGSTHKTFPGPQRGMVATNNAELLKSLGEVLSPPPFLLSCFHLNTVVALGVAAAEMLTFGKEYSRQIVRNSKALAAALQKEGVPIFTSAYGSTQSHQVILENGGFVSPLGIHYKECMEASGILADAVVRIGTQEVTRLGMQEGEMQVIARLIAAAVREQSPVEEIRAEVTGLAASFDRVKFTFDDAAAYEFISEG